MLNKYEASDDLVGKDVELKILLKMISILLGHRFNTAINQVLNFTFECYPKPMPSQQFKYAIPIWDSSCFLLFDLMWLSYKSFHPSHPSRGDSTWFRAMVTHDGALRSHSVDRPQFVELLWKSDQPDSESCTWKHSIHERQISMPPAVFELTIPASEWTQTPRLKPRGHWNWLV